MLRITKGELNSNIIIEGTLAPHLHEWTDYPDRKYIKKHKALNDTLHQIGLTDIYGIYHLKTAEYTFFSSAHRTLSRIDHILGHKSRLGKS